MFFSLKLRFRGIKNPWKIDPKWVEKSIQIWTSFENATQTLWKLILAPFWRQLGQLWHQLGPTWRQHGASWPQLGPTCSQLGPTWGQLGAQLRSKMPPRGGKRGRKKGTKKNLQHDPPKDPSKRRIWDQFWWISGAILVDFWSHFGGFFMFLNTRMLFHVVNTR